MTVPGAAVLAACAPLVGGLLLVWFTRILRRRPDLSQLFAARQTDRSPEALARVDRNLERVGWALSIGGLVMLVLVLTKQA